MGKRSGAGGSTHADPERAKAAWLELAQSGQVPKFGLRAHIERAWVRCQAHGVDPRTMAARRLTDPETAALLEQKRELIDAARPYLRALSSAAGAERHAAMLSDADGVVLDIVADEETAYRTEGFPTPGSLLAERIAGANGIGTPLAENAYVEVAGPEHFIEGFHVYTCQGLPLREADGAVIGALSMSVRRSEAAERVHEILVCAAHGIEAELSQRRLQHEVASVLRRVGHDAESTQLETLRQDVAQLQAAARMRIERAARVTQERRETARELIATADALIERFREQASLWRDIAFSEVGLPQPIDLQQRVCAIAELLATEAAIRSLRLEVRAGPALPVATDSRALSRTIFRSMLCALDASEPGTTIEAYVQAQGGSAQLRFSGPAVEGASVLLAHEGDRAEGNLVGQALPIVLIADDSPDFRDILLDSLRPELSCTLLEAIDGDEALAQLLAHDVAVAILDQRMPGLHGTDVVRRARELALRTDFILVSAALDIEERAAGLGVKGVMRKPFPLHELAVLVRHTLAARASTARS